MTAAAGGKGTRQVVVIGPTPPPHHGVAVMTGYIVEALEGLGACAAHLDTTDPRPVQTIGRLDLTNVLLGFRHAAQLHRILRQCASVDVLLPISQGRWGFLRDAVLVLVTRLHRRRLILHLHGGGLESFWQQSHRPMRWLIRTVLKQAHQAWALTPMLCSQFDGLVAESRVHCVANVVEDPQETEALAVSITPREPYRLRVLFLSNLLPEKGCFEVVAAARLLGDRARGWEIRLAGPAEPEIEQRLRREIAAAPIAAADIALVGPTTGQAKKMQYRWADVFLFPTRYPPEGQPMVLLEAMAAGLPIVTTPQGGIPDTVRDEVEGLLIPQGDIEGIARALVSLASSRDLRCSLGRAARARYEECFRPERLQRDLAGLFGCELPARAPEKRRHPPIV